MKKVKSRKAFTLAEVLITLGVIGIVAAMTLPAVVGKYQKKATVTKLQKTISILNQAYRLSISEVGYHDNAFELGIDEYFTKYWKPYIKVSKECSRNDNVYKECGYTKMAPFLWANKSNSDRNLSQGGGDRTVFYTNDGILYILHSGLHGNLVASNEIIIDINGGQGPNRWGRDVFTLQRTRDLIVPLGYDKNDEEVNNNCSSNGHGEFCLEKIRRNNWEIEENYPWN